MRKTINVLHRLGINLLAICFMLGLTTGSQESQAAPAKTWKPSRPLTIILGSYGGAYDFTARQLSRVLPEYLGQKVIVTAITGAGGANAYDGLHRSKPDGHTLCLLGIGTYVTLSVKNLYPWDVKDMPLVLSIDTPPYGVFTSPKSSYTSYDDVMRMKRVLRIAVGGSSFSILPLLVDFDRKGVQYKVARFKGSAEANLAVLATDADITLSALSGQQTDKIRSGDFRTLWVYDTKRFPLIANVPTHVELGMPRDWANYRIARLIQVPPGTPEHIQKALKEGLSKALKDKRTLDWSKKVDTPVDTLSDNEITGRIQFLIKGFKDNPQIVETYF